MKLTKYQKSILKKIGKMKKKGYLIVSVGVGEGKTVIKKKL